MGRAAGRASWLKPLRFTARSGPTAMSGAARDPPPEADRVMDFFRMEGEGIHEVAVGPVHAGIIEPGHFRFNATASRFCTWKFRSAISTAASNAP